MDKVDLPDNRIDARIGVIARKIADSDSRASQIDATIMCVFVSAFD
jgi:hypothetical protein